MRKLKNNELKRLNINEFKNSEKTPFIVVLDNIRSLNNIGSIFRTCDAMLIQAIYLCGFTATPPHKDIHKTALGATESVDWKYFKTTLEAVTELKENGYKVYAVEQVEHSIALQNFTLDLNDSYAFVLGNEVKGVDQQVLNACHGAIEIPQYGTKHSFNISISAGIILWDLFKKFKQW